MLNRRDLLKSMAAAPLAVPGTPSLGIAALRWLPGGDDRCLVVLELEGGNDGLATVIPTDDLALPKARKTLAGLRKGALPLAPGFALHPALRALHGLCARKLCAFVHAVGYPNPDRSHFKSRDIWHVADPAYTKATAETTGWLGRAADWLAERGAAVPGLALGGLGLPLVLRGKRVVVPALERIEDYQVLVDPAGGKEQQEARRQALVELARGGVARDSGDVRAFLGDVGRSAVDGAERMRKALAEYRPKASYPDTSLGKTMQLLARIVASGFGTRLFHVAFGGFDTHARQLPTHEGLLRLVDQALGALVQDLEAHGALGRVVILVHSEFGRRVAENASLGTDHGAAAPVAVLGQGLASPLLGEPASLTDLDDGDLRHRVDFRAIYSALLAWLGVDPVAVLGGRHEPLGLF